MEIIGKYVGLFCNERDLLYNACENALFVSVDFARSNPELIDYFFVIDDYSHEDLISFIGQNPLNPFKFMDKIEVFHSIHLKIEELSRRLINEEEVEGVTTVLYQSLAIQE